ncbi:DUF535 domain-containing protein [Pseudoduganella sp. CY13W]|uniref:DUF535 domain-containing protein n=2 Tax=Duganella qianjiadongensis TaxID=2692176 RepID=A0ABW9VSF0_9BURK|nr:DUF535 domain-containing protein [Duganella qianjiadongensis]
MRLSLITDFVALRASHDIFYHLSHRHYLSSFLSLRERAEFAVFHMRVEDRYFDTTYKNAVYLQGGLVLWEQVVEEVHFQIKLRMASIVAQEGDLEVALFVDEQRLHSFKFSWIDGVKIGLPGALVPWVTTCQGLRHSKTEAPEKFSVAFPNNWAKLFCLSALRGIALALGSEVFIGIGGDSHVALSSERRPQFIATYDDLWLSMNGTKDSRYGYHIPSRLPLKDLKAVPSKHRKRAEQRRQHWTEIEQRASAAISRCFAATLN